jgi:hypothetical protein
LIFEFRVSLLALLIYSPVSGLELRVDDRIRNAPV